jgi:transposase
MDSSIQAMRRSTRRRLQRTVQKSKDKNHVRRALALLHLAEGKTVSEVARSVCAARSTVQSWRGLYEEYGEAGLEPAPVGRSRWTVTDEVLEQLIQLLEKTPEDYGYLRASWTSELLALELERQLGVSIHASTVRRILPQLGYVWRRTRPILVRRDPNKNSKMRAVRRALQRRRGAETFYADEADIDLNPKTGAVWTRRGQQVGVPTPGQNEKHYVAGALHAHTGKLVWAEHPTKDSTLFIKLLEAVRKTYRAANRINFILDNYIIHKSELTERWLSKNPKFRMVFQPTYSPWVNQIERLWKAMHDTVTRNHRCTRFYDLAQRIIRFFEVVQPFPGNHQALATLKV